MKKIIALFLGIMLLAVSLALPAVAVGIEDVFISGDSSSLTGEKDGSVFVSGEEIAPSFKVNGLLFSIGKTLNVGGSDEYDLAAGYTVNLSGSTRKDAFLAGYALSVSGIVQRDVFAAGNTLQIFGLVGRNLYSTASSVLISGAVKGDVYLQAERITISDTASIGGTLFYNDNAVVQIADGSQIGATKIMEYPVPDAPNTSAFRRAPVIDLMGNLWSILGLVALSFVLMWLTGLFRTLDRKYTGAPFGKYAVAFGIGCAVLVGLPLVAIVLMVTVIGLRLAFALLLVYIAVIIAAPIFAAFFFGGLILRRLCKCEPNYYLELLVGVFLYRFVTLIPYVGGFIGFVCLAFGLGTATLLLGNKPAAPAKPAPGLPASPETPVSPE